MRAVDREMNPAFAIIATGLLFSLPNLRNVQPGVPPLTLYAVIDIWGFYIKCARLVDAFSDLLGSVGSPCPKSCFL